MNRFLPSIVTAFLVAAGVASSLFTRPVFLQPSEEPLVFDANSHGGPQTFLGGPQSFAPIEIWRPEGRGPFPAVILLHGCGGTSRHERTWAARLVQLGYIAVIPDSFRPRYVRPSCGRSLVNVALRAQDLLNLTTFLRTHFAIPADQTAVIGFSQGGGAALAVASDAAGSIPPFQAVVSYYSSCGLPPASHLAIDALILLGGDDNPNLIASCNKLVATQAGTPHAVQLNIYPGAIHNFDAMPGKAAPDSWAETEAFLAARLKAR